MGKRLQALKRIALVIPLILLTYIFGAFFYLFFIPWFIIDVLWQLVTGSDGLKAGGTASTIYQWQANNTMFVLFGKGQWSWAP